MGEEPLVDIQDVLRADADGQPLVDAQERQSLLEALADALCKNGRLADYTHLEHLETGGMGVVFKARSQDDRAVAIKVVHTFLQESQEDRQRYVNEVRLVARLQHPNIVSIQDFGVLQPYAFLVMEYVDGIGLDILFEEPPTDNAGFLDIVGIVHEVADAIGYAHGQGVLHRDLKPSNILVERAGTPERRPVVLDFGLAKDLHANQRLTRSSAAVGTPAYMAPEQVMGGGSDLTPATDVWALGVLLYQLCTGELPFEPGERKRLFQEILHTDPVMPRKRMATIPTDLETVIVRCLEKDPALRYSDGTELAEGLACLLSGERVKRGWGFRVRRWQRSLRRHPYLFALGLSLLLVTGAVATLSWYDHQRQWADWQNLGSNSFDTPPDSPVLKLQRGWNQSLPATWTKHIKNGQLSPNDGSWLWIDHPDLRNRFRIDLMARLDTHTDRLWVVLNGSPRDQIFGNQRPSGYLIDIVFGTEAANLTLRRNQNAGLVYGQPLRQINLDLQPELPFRLQIERIDDRITITVNGTEKTSFVDPIPIWRADANLVGIRGSQSTVIEDLSWWQQRVPERSTAIQSALLMLRNGLPDAAARQLRAIAFDDNMDPVDGAAVVLLAQILVQQAQPDIPTLETWWQRLAPRAPGQAERLLQIIVLETWLAGTHHRALNLADRLQSNRRDLALLISNPAYRPQRLESDVAERLAGLLAATFIGNSLNLVNLGVQDISFLADMPLRSLDLQGNQITDLGPLAGMPLRHLNLASTPVRDLTALASCKDLMTLNITDTRVSDLTPLTGLAQLDSVKAVRAPITSLSALADSQLSDLDIAYTAITSLDGLDTSRLRTARFDHTPIVDLSALRGAPLEAIALSGTRVRDLSPLDSPHLKDVTIIGAAVNSIDFLSTIHPRRLDLTGNEISSLTGIDLTGMTDLTLSGNRLTESPDLRTASLNRLTIAGNEITELAPLLNPNLERLQIQGTLIKDLSPLADFPILRYLDISGTPVVNLSPLTDRPPQTLVALNLTPNHFPPSLITENNLILFDWSQLENGNLAGVIERMRTVRPQSQLLRSLEWLWLHRTNNTPSLVETAARHGRHLYVTIPGAPDFATLEQMAARHLAVVPVVEHSQFRNVIAQSLSDSEQRALVRRRDKNGQLRYASITGDGRFVGAANATTVVLSWNISDLIATYGHLGQSSEATGTK